MTHYLQTLGLLALREGGREGEIVLADSKALVVVALLVVSPGHRMRRAHLAGLLWPEVPREKARRSLRQSLYYLSRRTGTDLVISENDHLELTAGLTCDMWELDRALQNPEVGAPAHLLSGWFLEGIDRRLGQEVGEWITLQNQRLLNARRELVRTLIDGALAGGLPEKALAFAREYADANPLDDDAQLNLIRTHKAIGDEAGAFDVYDGYRSRLKVALDDEPSEELQALVATLRGALLEDTEWKPLAPDPPTPDLDLLERRLFRRLGLPMVGAAVVLGIAAFAVGRFAGASGIDERLRNTSLESLEATVAVQEGDEGSPMVNLVLTANGIERRGALEHPYCAAARSVVSVAPGGKWAAVSISAESGKDLFVIECENGRELLRLSKKADETFKDFSPDGEHLLFGRGWNADDGSYAELLLRVEISTEAIDTVAVRNMTGEPQASWSPTGTHIAYILGRVGDRRLVISLADGSSPTLVETDVDATHPKWSPSGAMLSYLVHSGDGPALYVLDVENGSSRRLSPAGVAPGATFWVSDHLLAYLTGRLQELWVVDVVSGRQVTLGSAHPVRSFALMDPAPRAIWWDSVEISESGPVTPGEPLELEVRFVSAAGDGQEVAPGGFRWESADSTVVAIRDGTLEAIGLGRTEVVATLPGWRSARMAVEVAELTDSGIDPRLDEDWGGGILPDVWESFGDPEPVVLAALSPTGARSFVSNGDENYASGAISQQSFDGASGLTIEVEGQLAFTGNTFEAFEILLAEESPEMTLSGPQYLASLALNGPIRQGRLTRTNDDGVAWSFEVDRTGWHRYALQFEPDGTLTALIDGTVLARLRPGDSTEPLPHRLRVVLSGSSLGVEIKHGRVQVFEGLKYVFATGS